LEAFAVSKVTNRKPAILGGDPIFSTRLPIVSPKLPPLSVIEESVREILCTGNLTNNSRYVREFESALAARLDTPHVIAVANATLGLILALAGLKLDGEVILPSFTYCATAHALHWNRLTPVFVDILPDTFTLDPQMVEAATTPRTAAILAVHIYGHPCEIDELQAVARRHQIPLIFDAAHAIGSRYRDRPVGQFGEAEVFSFHATKVFPVGEGGCIATSQAELARYLALARKFGDPGDENTLFPGINAKMQEFNAILGLEALKVIDAHIANRRRYAEYLIGRLGHIPGISFQVIRPYVFMNYQNFAILIDDERFGLSRDVLFEALVAENVSARKYFYPPLHWHVSYTEHRALSLPVTEMVSKRVLCLPFYSEMAEEMLDGLCRAIERIQAFSSKVRRFMN
jgi:dTDP-4-amino-4,6-dideoxygalactose transaminase